MVSLLCLCYLTLSGCGQDEVAEIRDLAKQGDEDAQLALGRCYYSGVGVPQDHKKSAKWFRLAAEQGNREAQAMLGVSYECGNGVPHDYAEAAKWFHLAAEQGEARAQAILGSCYDLGEGVPQDYKEAVKWYRFFFLILFGRAIVSLFVF